MTETSLAKKIGKFNFEEDSVDAASSEILGWLGIQYYLIQAEKSLDAFIEEIVKPLFSDFPKNLIHLNVIGN